MKFILIAKKFIENKAKIKKAKYKQHLSLISQIKKSYQPQSKFGIPVLIMNIINPSPDPMKYLEEKRSMIRNYWVSLILDTSYSSFIPLSTSFSLQTLRLMLSTLTSIDLSFF